MKKLLLILFTVAMVLMLASCDEKEDDTQNNDAKHESKIENVLGEIEQLPNDHESIVESMGDNIRNYKGIIEGNDAVLTIKDGVAVVSVVFTSGDSIDGLEYEAVVSNSYFGSALSEKDGKLEVRFVKGRTSAVLSGEGVEAFKADAIPGISSQEGEECGKLCEGYFNGETVTLSVDSPYCRFFLGNFMPKKGNVIFILTDGGADGVNGSFEVIENANEDEDDDNNEDENENEELEYYPSGNLKTSTYYDGQTGNIAFYTEYYDAEGAPIKLRKHYNENGILQTEEGYDINGDQTLRVHYYEDGSLDFREEKFEDGSENYESYDEFGNPVSKTGRSTDGSRWSIMYMDGILHEENYFNANDILIRGVRYNDQGKLYFDEYFDDEGNRTKRYDYNMLGELDSIATYFKNGEMQTSVQYMGKNVTYEHEWYENGELKKEIYYRSNGKVERHVEFFENGDTSLYIEYDENDKLKIKDEYYENGNPKYSYMIWPRFGVENSECETWYYENGNMKKDHTKFPDGGQRIDEYYEDGTQKYHYFEYEDGTNYERYYDENGNQIN